MQRTLLRTTVRAAVGALAIAAIVATASVASAGKPTASGGGGKPKPGTGGTGTISLVLPADGVANWGDQIRFNVSTTATTQPYVRLVCTQDGQVVASGREAYYPGTLDDGNFGLYSSMWTGGAADCTAKLEKRDGTVLGTTSFHVDA
jgi:hypothetical protein